MTPENKYVGYFNGSNIHSVIEYKPKGDACQVVEKIWFTGSLSFKEDDASPKLHLHLLTKDNLHYTFTSEDLSKVTVDDLLKQVDEWVNKQLIALNYIKSESKSGKN